VLVVVVTAHEAEAAAAATAPERRRQPAQVAVILAGPVKLVDGHAGGGRRAGGRAVAPARRAQGDGAEAGEARGAAARSLDALDLSPNGFTAGRLLKRQRYVSAQGRVGPGDDGVV